VTRPPGALDPILHPRAGVRGIVAISAGSREVGLEGAAQIVADFPEIAQLDMNPLLAFGDGAVAVDARFRIAGATA
jgi:acetyltransferase